MSTLLVENLFVRFLKWVRLQIFMIRPRDTDFTKLGIYLPAAQKPGLEAIVEAFRQGYNLTLADDEVATLKARMTSKFDPAFIGFAHEGTGMALTLCDWFSYQKRAETYLKLMPKEWDSLLMLGVGFALARLPWVPGGAENYARRFPGGFDGLVLNGYGFHEGCFKSRGEIDRTPIPSLSAGGLRCFDHGLGRAMWFVCGGNPQKIGETLAKIPARRHQDIWVGLGTALCFAGRAYADMAEYDRVLNQMRELAGAADRETMMLGVGLAAVLQVRSNYYTPWVQRACEVLLGMPAAEAGAMIDKIWNDTLANAELARTPYGVYQTSGDAVIEIFKQKLRRS